MFKKISFSTISIITLLLAFSVSHSYADVSSGWAVCQVIETQAAGTGNVSLNLTDVKGAFTETWIRVEQDVANQALATAYTALTMGYNVKVRIVDNSGYKIDAIRILPE